MVIFDSNERREGNERWAGQKTVVVIVMFKVADAGLEDACGGGKDPKLDPKC